MINKRVIKKFLNRKLEDWNCVKELTELEVWEELDLELPDEFHFKTTPWKHQAASFICGLHNKDFIFFLDMGLGKSLLVANILYLYALQGDLSGKTLILAPNEVGISEWEGQIEEHTDFTYTSLLGKKDEKWKLFDENDTDLYIISYDGLLSMLTALQPSKKKDDKTKKQQPVPKLVKKFTTAFQGLILDELHICKNMHTLAYRLCNYLAKNCDFRYGLTGTPFGRKPIDLWAQFFLIDRGETLGSTLGFFQECYFRKVGNGFGYEWQFDMAMEKKLHKAMRHKSLRYAEEELDSMPPKVYKTIKVPFSSEAYQYYELAHADLLESQGNYQMLKNSFMRKRQIVSGYVDFKDEEENRQRITFKENPRLDALMDYVTRTKPESKIVIFVEFTPSGDMIAERLTKAKFKFERLYSGTKDKIAAKNNFVNDTGCKILLANSKSGGVNLNLQVADHEVFYECPVSPIVRRQAEKRAPRGAKTKTTYIVDIMVKNSVDEDVWEFIKEGKDLFAALVEGKGGKR